MQFTYEIINGGNKVNQQTVEKIIVLDFGSQYNQLITRRIREFGVFSELLPNDTTAEQIKAEGNVIVD